MMELLDVRPLEQALDNVVRIATAGAQAKAVLQLAQSVLKQARAAAAIEDDPGTRSWHGVRVVDGELAQVTCWNESRDALLLGVWEGTTLNATQVTAGEHSWGVRETEAGESRISSDGELEGPADRARFSDVARRAQLRLGDWQSKNVAMPWNCSRCSWNNLAGVTECAICGASAALVRSGAALPAHGDAGWGMVIPEVPQIAARAEGELEPSALTPAHYEVVLRAVPADRKVSIVTALRDCCGSLSLAKQFAERAPAVVRERLSKTEADALRQQLEGAGAVVEVREAAR